MGSGALILFFILIVSGAFLIFKKPLQDYGFPRAFELGVATILLLIAFFQFAILVLVPIVDAQSMAGQPCTDSRPEIACYTLSKENCLSGWKHFSESCNQEVRSKIDPDNLSALIGPSVKRCVYKTLDRSFHSMRKTPREDFPQCEEYFKKLDEPSVD